MSTKTEVDFTFKDKHGQMRLLELGVAFAKNEEIFFNLEDNELADSFVIESLTRKKHVVTVQLRNTTLYGQFSVPTFLSHSPLRLRLFQAELRDGKWSDLVLVAE